MVTRNSFRFDRYTLDLARACLRRGDEVVRLRPKAFDVLRYLVENPGRLVSKDELMGAVWANVTVTDDSIVQCIREVRHALDDQARRLIETAPRRGYVFAARSRGPIRMHRRTFPSRCRKSTRLPRALRRRSHRRAAGAKGRHFASGGRVGWRSWSSARWSWLGQAGWRNGSRKPRRRGPRLPFRLSCCPSPILAAIPSKATSPTG